METVFVFTHLVMIICIGGILYMSISSRSNNDWEEKSSDHYQASISKAFLINAPRFYRMAASYLALVIK